MSIITAKTKLCAVIGDPVEHSLSPKMHNAAFKELGIEDQFVYVGFRVQIEKVKEALEGMKALGIRYFACTIPHKMEVMKYLDEIDPVAKKIGAVNTVINDNGTLKGYNTDWLGLVIPMEREIEIKGKKAALIGAGGAARALAYAVLEKGATLTIYNRTLEKAQELAQEVGAEAKSLDDLEEVNSADIIMNSTSIGMDDTVDQTPVPAEYLNTNQVVFDAVYVPYETRLLQEAKEKGAKIIHGIDMLLYQGTAQFEMYTGKQAPEEVMKQSLLAHFGIDA
jgi:shikimate dehydrogenase